MKLPSKYIITIAAMTAVSALSLSAITPTEVETAVRAAKDAPKNQAVNREAAQALKDAGRYEDAISFYLKGGNQGNLGIAESYFMLYDYDKAEEYLDKYLAKRTKVEEKNDKEFSYGNGTETMDWTDHLRSKIELGRSMLDRVEKIQVIDSINVPADEFLKYFKLTKSAGQLVDESRVESIISNDQFDALGISNIWAPAYMSEAGDDVIWYGSTQDGDSKMFESTRLTDGSWDKPVTLFDYASIFGDSNGSWVSYPFLMSDGITLYFAADGDSSLGELDIFISRKDSDGFLQPSNIGMPYNSPFNDYLYAIDEQTGAGWWVTDRNQIQDSVTIYTFIPQDLRINYPVDTPDLIGYAKLSSIAMTQEEGGDYEGVRKRISQISDNKSNGREHLFDFSLPNGKILHSMNDFSSRQAASAMRDYLTMRATYARRQSELANLRARYSNGDKTIGDRILSLEKEAEMKKMDLRRLKNRVITLETRM